MSSPSTPIAGERRRTRRAGESVAEFLETFPASVALSRLPVPILGVDDRGAIEFANNAFAAMVGHSPEALLSMTVQALVDCAISGGPGVVAALRGYANTVIALRHADGWLLPALVSESVLIRSDETLAVVALTDLSELVWHASPDNDLPQG